ncbi:unnamed protein product [Rotaria sordida]|uniref:Uncharacterized protein n=1 Tax=Rotaria sordida TaxID=392033 RepID=A0A819J403_9BILA|nr:unnamed protein product [Rotaria sordida]CAF3924090.1 unnamed protein product [Rotaria sordida]
MTETLEINNENKKVMYAFRFTTSNKCIHLNQKQLDSIPYLSAIVAHKHDFLSTRNENGEYLLNSPIQYTWFMAVLHSIILGQSYTLFTELPERENILGTLQLFDYLGLNSFDLPLLKGKKLVLSNPSDNNNNEKRSVGYYKANLMEARNTATKFIIAISKNLYDLLDTDTESSIEDPVINDIHVSTEWSSIWNFISREIESERKEEVSWERMKEVELEQKEKVKLERKKKEAQSARLGYFNIFSKLQNIDKFKHRSGPKAQKYRKVLIKKSL